MDSRTAANSEIILKIHVREAKDVDAFASFRYTVYRISTFISGAGSRMSVVGER